MKPGERLDLKTFEATRTDAKGRVKCFLDLIHVAAPKGEPAMGTFRFSCL